MGILDKATVIETQERSPVKVRFNKTSEPVMDLVLPERRKYVITLSVSAMFYANTAEYESSMRLAERTLIHTLYGETLSKLDSAIRSMMNDEPHEALKYLGAIREELTK